MVATNLPLAVFAQEIAGDRIVLEFPVPPDVDPPFWKPTPEDVTRMQQAKLILMNGATYERWGKRVTLPASRTVDTSASFRNSYIEIANVVTHSHGPGGAHSHKGTAFTTWVDFTQAAAQARAVAQALIKLESISSDAEAVAATERRAGALTDRLQALAVRTEAAGKQFNGAPLLGSHPIYEYLARRANLNLQSVHWEPDEAPSAEQWAELDKLTATHPAKIMLWEAEPLDETAAKLKERGIASVVFAPMANSEDRTAAAWLSAMEANVARLEAAASARPAS